MANVQNLTKLLEDATKNRYAVGSFSARYTKLIKPIIQAAINTNSPAIVQLSEKEVIRHKVGVKEFADEFYRVVKELDPKVPLALHLDHTKTLDVIREAMDAGFTSVMIDASEMDYADNVAVTKEVVAMAHPRNITVEAELGKIGTTDFVETDHDEELYTDPQEAKSFCEETNVDCLAVSVGTAHGVYTVRQPKVDYARLEEINKLTDTPPGASRRFRRPQRNGDEGGADAHRRREQGQYRHGSGAGDAGCCGKRRASDRGGTEFLFR